ncbi:MAG: glycosyltransferase family 39 protein [Limnothrix sp. RL_2_0]|nr:glycosyltransferase family 39 protein [Limnothrix sp. RL_2_0]
MFKTTSKQQPWSIDGWVVLFLAIAALTLWLINLGELPLRDWDEGYYATTARDIYWSNNWFDLTYLQEHFWYKPPLMFWLTAFSYHLFGVSEFSSRLPVATITALGVPLLYLVSKELFQERSPALLSAGTYLTLLPVVRHGRLAMMDGLILTLVLISSWGLLKGRSPQSKWIILLGLGLGGIALTKSILAILIAAIFFFIIIINRWFFLLKNLWLWLGLLLGILPILGWYALQIDHYGEAYIQVHFQSQSIDRITSAIEGNDGSIFYYALEIFKYTWPWLLFLPQGLILGFKERQKVWAKFALGSAGLYFIVVSIMGTKLPWYIFPIYPFLCLIIGASLTHYQKNLKKIKSTKFLAGIFFFLSLVSIIGEFYFLQAEPQLPLLILAPLLAVTFLITGILLWRKKNTFIAVLMSGTYLVLILLFCSDVWLWELNEAFSVKPVGLFIQEKLSDRVLEKPIYTSFAYNRPSLDFYSEVRVIPQNPTELQALAKQDNYFLLNAPNLENLETQNPEILGSIEIPFDASQFYLVHTKDQ